MQEIDTEEKKSEDLIKAIKLLEQELKLKYKKKSSILEQIILFDLKRVQV